MELANVKQIICHYTGFAKNETNLQKNEVLTSFVMSTCIYLPASFIFAFAKKGKTEKKRGQSEFVQNHARTLKSN